MSKHRKSPKRKPQSQYPVWDEYQRVFDQGILLFDVLLERYDRSVEAMVADPGWDDTCTEMAMNYASESAKEFSKLAKELKRYVKARTPSLSTDNPNELELLRHFRTMNDAGRVELLDAAKQIVTGERGADSPTHPATVDHSMPQTFFGEI